jgi:queuine tRNA-ribosyltransferase
MNNFTLIKNDHRSRIGSFITKHGIFETPNFMPVGTRASVKGLHVGELINSGVQITLVNTYHLWLRPGEDLVKSFGGIHKFCGWNGPILSDSGGYQIFSLKNSRSVTAEGVWFKSHLDGSRRFLSPEKAIAIQSDLGVDIAMVLDECPPPGMSKELIAQSLELTLNWAKRCYEEGLNNHEDPPLIFGITQGGIFPELRAESAIRISEIPFAGYAIGGLSVGEAKELMYEVLSYHPSQLPENKIRYLMGSGTPEDIVFAVINGIDLFDCVIPTRAGRFGRAYCWTTPNQINIKNSQWRQDESPLDFACECVACKQYSRAYLHHLFRCGEMLGPVLLSLHNVSYYMSLMKKIREAIAGNYLFSWAKENFNII